MPLWARFIRVLSHTLPNSGSKAPKNIANFLLRAGAARRPLRAAWLLSLHEQLNKDSCIL